jgi:hypothetical protein
MGTDASLLPPSFAPCVSFTGTDMAASPEGVGDGPDVTATQMPPTSWKLVAHSSQAVPVYPCCSKQSQAALALKHAPCPLHSTPLGDGHVKRTKGQSCAQHVVSSLDWHRSPLSHTPLPQTAFATIWLLSNLSPLSTPLLGTAFAAASRRSVTVNTLAGFCW